MTDRVEPESLCKPGRRKRSSAVCRLAVLGLAQIVIKFSVCARRTGGNMAKGHVTVSRNTKYTRYSYAIIIIIISRRRKAGCSHTENSHVIKSGNNNNNPVFVVTFAAIQQSQSLCICVLHKFITQLHTCTHTHTEHLCDVMPFQLTTSSYYYYSARS